MARVKFLVWCVIVVAVAAANLIYLDSTFERTVSRELSTRLATAVAAYSSQDASVQAQRALTVGQAARDPSLLSTFRELRSGEAPPRDALSTWASVYGSAAQAAPGASGAAALYAISNDAGMISRSSGGESKVTARDLPLGAASNAFPRPVGTVIDGVPYRVFAFAVHERERVLGTVGVAFPLDDAYCAALAKVTGAQITVLSGEKVLGSSLAGSLRTDLAKAAKGSAFTAGKARIGAFLGMGLPFFSEAPPPALKGSTVPLEGVDSGRVAITIDAEPSYAALGEYQARYLPGWVALVALSLGVFFILGSGEPAEEDRGIRTLGEARPLSQPPPPPAPTPAPAAVSEALSSLPPAPEASPDDFHFGHTGHQAVASSPEAPPPSSSTTDPFADFSASPFASNAPPPPPEPDPFAPTAMRDDRASAPIDPFSAAALPAESRGYESDATVVAQVPEQLLRASARPPARPVQAPSSPATEESHYQEVFREFVATRERCGEPADGLTFEKFAAKLRKNKDQLVAKYNCKTVRFQVYVKEGKAALKATPVKE